MPRPISPDRLVSLYVLRAPDGTPRYVGISADPKKRLSVHCSPSERAKNNPKARWINELAQQQQRPQLSIIREVLASEADRWEQECITFLNRMGTPLLNRQPGGRFYGSRP